MPQGRDVWIWRWLDHVRQDTVFALRSVRRQPGFTAVAVATVALGIGANTAVFSVADALLLRPPPFAHAERLFWIQDVNDQLHGSSRSTGTGY